MRYSVITFLLVFCLASSIQSQSAFKWGGLGYASAGFQKLNFSNSEVLLENTISYRDGFNFQFGGGGFLLLGSKYILMGQGYGSIYDRESSASSALQATYGGGGINFGYALMNKRTLVLFPTIGVGGSGYNLEVENSGDSDIQFGNETILQDQVSEFQLGGAYVDLNMNIHKLFDFNSEDGEAGGISVGFTLGYQFPTGENQWGNVISNNVVGGLDPNNKGAFYFRLLVGGGGFKM